MSEMADYQLFGLRICSEIPLPELFPAGERSGPDVTIRRSELARFDVGPDIQPDGEGLLLNVPEVARFRIGGGREILVDVEPGVPERNVRLFLLGSAMGVLVHQRGLLPLHANAVEIEGKAVAFLGPSGAGKSTLAAWFHDQGHRVIADDVCVVGFNAAGRAHAAPGLPRLRLWTEALTLMGRNPVAFERSYISDEHEKFDVPMDASSAVLSEMPLAAVYLLGRGPNFSVSPLRGLEATDAIYANTYRGSYLPVINGHREHWKSAVRLVRATPVFKVDREWELRKLTDQCTLMLEHARRQIGEQS